MINKIISYFKLQLSGGAKNAIAMITAIILSLIFLYWLFKLDTNIIPVIAAIFFTLSVQRLLRFIKSPKQ